MVARIEPPRDARTIEDGMPLLHEVISPGMPPTICLPGIAPASPFASLFAQSKVPMATAPWPVFPADRRWRRSVAGTDMQWWSDGAASSGEDAATGGSGEVPGAMIIVDLFGNHYPGAAAPPWRLVDADGAPILSPFAFLDGCCRPPFLASILLTGASSGAGDGMVIAEAHVSNRIRYTVLLSRIARAAAHLVILAASGQERPGTPGRRTTLAGGKTRRARMPARLARARIARLSIVAPDWIRNERWAVGRLCLPTESLIRSQVITPDHWIPSPDPHAYFADPFPARDEPDTFLCERYDLRRSMGEIGAVTAPPGSRATWRRLDVPGRQPHLSYPCVFRDGDRDFVLPEMAASGEQLLLHVLPGGGLRPVAVVAKARMADPTLFRHQGLYWIAYTDMAFGVQDNLCLLHAPRLEGPWTPHRLNPVKIDIRSSRPGGTPFRLGDRLFRPAQDCSVAYGGALTINEVLTCRPDAYAETMVATLRPDPDGPYPHGLHTLSIGDGVILVDGRRIFLDPRRFLAKAARYSRRLRDKASRRLAKPDAG
jgi:hypothetical protein